jgi:hypothetical protein
VVADSFVLRNRQLLAAAKRWWQYYLKKTHKSENQQKN